MVLDCSAEWCESCHGWCLGVINWFRWRRLCTLPREVPKLIALPALFHSALGHAGCRSGWHSWRVEVVLQWLVDLSGRSCYLLLAPAQFFGALQPLHVGPDFHHAWWSDQIHWLLILHIQGVAELCPVFSPCNSMLRTSRSRVSASAFGHPDLCALMSRSRKSSAVSFISCLLSWNEFREDSRAV